MARVLVTSNSHAWRGTAEPVEIHLWPKEIGTDVVSVGTRVRVKDVDHGDVDTYEIVGSAEADPANSRLSNESPVGRALIGHKKGETVEVSVPAGAIRLKIMDIKAA